MTTTDILREPMGIYCNTIALTPDQVAEALKEETRTFNRPEVVRKLQMVTIIKAKWSK